MSTDTKKPKRIAIVSTWFPPQQSVATNRILSFVEFLTDDFEMEVFAMDRKAHSVTWNERVMVHYQPSNRLFERLKSSTSSGKLKHKAKTAAKVVLSKVVKNPLATWQRAVASQLATRHAAQPFDLVISSFSPQEAHLAVVDFFRKHGKLPWIADMRDEMSANPYLSPGMKRSLEEVEAQVNEYATAITSVSLPILNDFKQNCPSVRYFAEIRNGFNHDFKRDTSLPANEVFSLGYFGTFYGSRKPDYLFKALVNLMREERDFKFHFLIVGAHANFEIPAELRPFMTMHPGMKYRESIETMATVDLNVVMHPASIQKGIFTGKLFDYISVQQPVLALVDSTDVAAQLVRDFDCGYVAEFDQVAEITEAIRLAWNNWNQGDIKFASDENRDSLHRKFQVDQLKKCVNQILNNEGA